MAPWFVYMMSNNAHRLYVGATNDLPSRVLEHKTGSRPDGFTARYAFDRCVWFECVGAQKEAIERERQIKKWSRAKKIGLIEASNPWWRDLSERFRIDAILR